MPWWGWVIVAVVAWIAIQMIRAELRARKEAAAILQHLQATEAWVMSAHAAIEPGLRSGTINAAEARMLVGDVDRTIKELKEFGASVNINHREEAQALYARLEATADDMSRTATSWL